MDETGEEDYLDIELRSFDAIVNRILVLRALFNRGSLELLWEEGVDEFDVMEEERFDSLAELVEQHANDELTKRELAKLRAPVGTLNPEEAENLSLGIESLASIGETVHLVDALPSPPLLALSDTDFLDLARALDRPTLEASISLPSDEEAARRLEMLDLWIWRAEKEIDLRDARGRPDRIREIEESINRVVTEVAAASYFVPTSDFDFPTGGAPVRNWSDDDLEVFLLALSHRFRGVSWLIGKGETWDDVYYEV